MTLHPEGEGDEKGELREKGERDPARAHVDQAGEPARQHDEDGQYPQRRPADRPRPGAVELLRQHMRVDLQPDHRRSEEHTSELQSLMRISYAVFYLKHKIRTSNHLSTSQ